MEIFLIKKNLKVFSFIVRTRTYVFKIYFTIKFIHKTKEFFFKHAVQSNCYYTHNSTAVALVPY